VRGATVAVAAACCASPAAAHAATFVAPYRISHDYYGLGPGEAEVTVDDAGNGYEFRALSGVPVQVRVIGRPLGRGQGAALWLKFQSSDAPCARSYGRDRGTPVKLGPTLPAVRPPDVIAIAPRFHRFLKTRTSGVVRFCTWIAHGSKALARPTVQDVPFVDTMFGAAVASHVPVSEDTLSPLLGAANLGYDVSGAATFPFVMNANDGCSAPETTTAFRAAANEFYGTLLGSGGPGCGTDSFSFQGDAAPVTFSFPSSEVNGTRGLVIKSSGDCDFMSGYYLPLAEALSYVQAVGCRVRAIIVRSRFDIASYVFPGLQAQPGSVYLYEEYAQRATLVPRGSPIDLIVAGI
jgi:hypothetical protein